MLFQLYSALQCYPIGDAVHDPLTLLSLQRLDPHHPHVPGPVLMSISWQRPDSDKTHHPSFYP